MEESVKLGESHLSSAVAFVEGGIQEACEDACSICLEVFEHSDPATVTSCRHEFHLQCILEWCQRSSQCPMCWQQISFKDSISQDLFNDIESERNITLNQSRNSTVFYHPALVDFNFQDLPVNGSDIELEERIFQHLAAAAAMGRTQHIARRGQRIQSGSDGHPQILNIPTLANIPSTGSISVLASPHGQNESVPTNVASSELDSAIVPEESANQDLHVLPTNPNLEFETNQSPNNISPTRMTAGQSTPVSQNRPGPSDFQSFSESLKSRLNAFSTRYKDSITKSTRGWREKLFCHNSSVADLGSEVRREVHATVSRVMEHLEARDRNRSPAVDAHPSLETSDEGSSLFQNSIASTTHLPPSSTN